MSGPLVVILGAGSVGGMVGAVLLKAGVGWAGGRAPAPTVRGSLRLYVCGALL